MSDTKILSTKTVYTSRYFKVLQKLIKRNGKTFTKDIIHRNASVLIIPYVNNEIYIESNYRDALEKMNLEIVQGTIEEGDDPFETAKRELQEEVGLTAKKWDKLAVWNLAGNMDITLHLFAATDLEEGEQQLDFEEDIEIQKIPLEKILGKIENGEFTTATHIAALLLFDKLRKEGKL